MGSRMDQAGEVLIKLFAPPVVAAFIGLIALGLGSFIVRPLTGTNYPPFVESFAFGAILISLLTFFWGMFGWMTAYVKWSLGLVLILAGISGLLQGFPRWPVPQASFKNRTILVLSLLLAVGILMRIILNPLFPPLATDECSFWLPSVNAFLESGRMEFNPHISFDSHPQNAEMLYTWAITNAPLTTSHYLNFLAFAFTMLAVVRLGRIVYSLKIGWLAAIITASLLELQLLSGQAAPDLWLLFYIVAALLCTAEGVRDGNPGRIILAGILFGGAAGTGYTALIAIITLAISFTLVGLKKNLTLKLPKWSIYGAFFAFILLAAPWYVRNILWFHNPVFPFYSSVFLPGGGIFGEYGPECAIRTGWIFHTETAKYYFEKGELWPEILKLWPAWIGIPSGLWFWRSSLFVRISITWTILIWGFWMIFGEGILHFPYLMCLIPVNIIVLAHFFSRVYTTPPGSERGRFIRVMLWILLVGWIGIAGAGTSRFNPPLTSDREVRILSTFNSSYDLVTMANTSISENMSALGILCGDGRLYADFKLIGGSDTGWGNHRVISDNCTSAAELVGLMLNRYHTNYLIVNEERLHRIVNEQAHQRSSEMYWRINNLLRSDDFNNNFKEVARVGEGAVYIVRSD